MGELKNKLETTPMLHHKHYLWGDVSCESGFNSTRPRMTDMLYHSEVVNIATLTYNRFTDIYYTNPRR